MFGDNLPAFYAEQARHQAEAQESIDRARRVTQELINDALDRLTFFGGDRLAALPEAERMTTARQEAVRRELHESLLEAKHRHNERVEELRTDDEEEPS